MPRINALVTPALLEWARTSIGLSLDEAARRSQVKKERLEKWENGGLQPTINQARNAAELYKRPLAVFYLPEPPKDFSAMRDFRRFPGDIIPETSYPLHVEIRLTQQRREIVIELLDELGIEAKEFTHIATSKSAEAVASQARNLLDIPLQEQFGWKDSRTALANWKSGLSRLGVLVFETRSVPVVPISEMRGFSISEEIAPAVVVNSADALNGKIFTLLHEFTHILLNSGGICNLREVNVAVEEQQIEMFCNQVAGLVLVPSEDLLNEGVVKQHIGNSWSDEELQSLARKYSVSRDVILRRLLMLGKTTNTFYQTKHEEFTRAAEKRKAELKEEQSGFAP